MAVNVTKHVGAGLASFWWTISDGTYMQGGTTAPTAGNQDGQAMSQLLGAKSWPFAPVDPDRPTATGDDGAKARFLFNPTDLPEASAVFSVGDYDFAAAAVSMLVDTVGDGSFIGLQPSSPTYRDLIFLATSQAKSQETGTVGSGMFEHRLIIKANAFQRLRTAFEERAIGNYEYAMVANYADYYPWGEAFTVGNQGDTQFVGFDFTWPYKAMLQRWTGNNTEVTFNFTKNVAEDSATNVLVWVDGVAGTWVTGATAGGQFGVTLSTTDTLVFGTAPGAAAKIVALYGWS